MFHLRSFRKPSGRLAARRSADDPAATATMQHDKRLGRRQRILHGKLHADRRFFVELPPNFQSWPLRSPAVGENGGFRLA
jgi:hypothetical protein